MCAFLFCGTQLLYALWNCRQWEYYLFFNTSRETKGNDDVSLCSLSRFLLLSIFHYISFHYFLNTPEFFVILQSLYRSAYTFLQINVRNLHSHTRIFCLCRYFLPGYWIIFSMKFIGTIAVLLWKINIDKCFGYDFQFFLFQQGKWYEINEYNTNHLYLYFICASKKSLTI